MKKLLLIAGALAAVAAFVWRDKLAALWSGQSDAATTDKKTTKAGADTKDTKDDKKADTKDDKKADTTADKLAPTFNGYDLTALESFAAPAYAAWQQSLTSQGKMETPDAKKKWQRSWLKEWAKTHKPGETVTAIPAAAAVAHDTDPVRPTTTTHTNRPPPQVVDRSVVLRPAPRVTSAPPAPRDHPPRPAPKPREAQPQGVVFVNATIDPAPAPAYQPGGFNRPGPAANGPRRP